MRRNGFSMVEVVIAITIIGVVGIFVSTVLTRSYKASNQSDKLGKLKQNGQVAIDLMAESIRNAEGVVCYGGTVSRKTSIVIRNLDGKYIKYKFIDPVYSGGSVTSNGYIIKQEFLNPSDYDNFCTTDLASPTPVAITNNNNSTGVSVSDGEFDKLTPSTSSKDSVMISFQVSNTLTAVSASDSDTTLMQTTVQVR